MSSLDLLFVFASPTGKPSSTAVNDKLQYRTFIPDFDPSKTVLGRHAQLK